MAAAKGGGIIIWQYPSSGFWFFSFERASIQLFGTYFAEVFSWSVSAEGALT